MSRGIFVNCDGVMVHYATKKRALRSYVRGDNQVRVVIEEWDERGNKEVYELGFTPGELWKLAMEKARDVLSCD